MADGYLLRDLRDLTQRLNSSQYDRTSTIPSTSPGLTKTSSTTNNDLSGGHLPHDGQPQSRQTPPSGQQR